MFFWLSIKEEEEVIVPTKLTKCNVLHSKKLNIFSVDPNISGICRVDWKDLKLGADSYRFLLAGKIYNTVVSVKSVSENYDAPDIDAEFGIKKYLLSNKGNGGSLSTFRPITGWGLHWFVWKSQRE